MKYRSFEGRGKTCSVLVKEHVKIPNQPLVECDTVDRYITETESLALNFMDDSDFAGAEVEQTIVIGYPEELEDTSRLGRF